MHEELFDMRKENKTSNDDYTDKKYINEKWEKSQQIRILKQRYANKNLNLFIL